MKYLILTYFLILSNVSFGQTIEEIGITNLPKIGNINGQDLFLGGLSGLTALDNTTYISISDRGPNTRKFDFNKDGIPDRGFLLPNFTPQIVFFNKEGNSLTYKRTLPIKYNGSPISGRPNMGRTKNSTSYDETPFAPGLPNRKLPFDKIGLDPEGITVDHRGRIWICEEYGPSILILDKQANIIKRFIPNAPSLRFGHRELPALLAKRKLNRGLEGITFNPKTKKIIAILQTPIPNGSDEAKYKRINHMIEINANTDTVSGHYLYQMKKKKGKKIGAITYLKDNSFLVLEQNGKTGKKSYKKIFKIDLDQATNLLNKRVPNLIFMTKSDLSKQKIRVAPKKEILDLNDYNLREYEKMEGLQVDGKDLYLVVDNDFGIHDLYNVKTGKYNKTKIKNLNQFFVIKAGL